MKPEHISLWWQQALVYVCMSTPHACQENLLVNIHIRAAMQRAKVVLIPHKHHIMDNSQAVDHVIIMRLSVVTKMITKSSFVLIQDCRSACIS